MGEVYRARDARLDRIVAIKILPEYLAENPQARERFQREARAVSSFSHPNICHLYDIGEQSGVSYLVMEFLDGETLEKRLQKGPLPIEQVLKLAAEICDGLEKAHRSGVIHRDLKPSNIMLTKSGAKLMDFGLARAPAVAVGSSADSLATMSRPLTAEGTIVGTVQYMAPEQLEGREADARSDIFSLGAVLYEMVTGKRAFDGKTTASTIAAILAGEPKPITTAQPMSPPPLEHLINSCLAKDPDERLQTAHDAKVQLRWVAQSSSEVRIQPRPGTRPRTRIAWWVTGLLFLLLMASAWAWWFEAHESLPAMYFNAPLPFTTNDVALSPDRRTVGLVAYSEQANKYVIWRYEIGGREAIPVPGTEDASHPFWSPDGRSIGFFSQGRLKKVDAFSGRAAQVLCDAPFGRGGTWNRDGVILFSPNIFAGLYRVSSAGGTPVEVTKVDESRAETSHRWPVFLPDGRHFLYLGANFAGAFDKNAVFVGDLQSGEKRLVVGASSNAAYADPGYLLFWNDGSLVAQHFNLRTYEVSGEPRTISDEVQYFPQTDLAPFSVAGKDRLVVQTGKGADKSQLTWFDRSGKLVSALGSPGLLVNPSLSPDGTRVAFEQTDRDGRHVDIWIRDVGSDTIRRLTLGPGLNELPIWSPDSKRIAFTSNEKTYWRLSRKNADGSGSEQPTAEPITWGGFWDWSRDGKSLLVWRMGELWYVSLPQEKLQPLFTSSWRVRNAQFSPNGKWVAYSSNATGSWEIYVSPFPRADTKWQVSRGGGTEPRWRRDGKELFYLSAEAKMTAVTVKADNNFEAGSPTTLFQTHLRQPISALDIVSYDVTANGQKFLVNTKVDEANAAPLSVILNWASEMEK